MKEEVCFVLLHTLSSSCPLSDHWECFSYELREDGNNHNHGMQCHRLCFFDLYRLYSVVYFIVVFLSLQSPRDSLRTFLSHCKVWHFCYDHIWNWCSVSLKCSKHYHWAVNYSKHLDYYCYCFLTWNPSESLHTTCRLVSGPSLSTTCFSTSLCSP